MCPQKQTGKMQKRKSIFNWQEVPNNVKNIPFTAIARLCPDVSETLETNCNELDLFTLFCRDEFFEMIARETNDYAFQEINRASRKNLKSDKNWTCVTKDKLKSYVAQYIAMSQVKKTLYTNELVQKKNN